jgi:hypothetical protein
MQLCSLSPNSQAKAIMLNDGKKMETRFFKFLSQCHYWKEWLKISYGVFLETYH